MDYQIDFGALMGIWMMKQKATTRFNQMTSHFNVVMREIEQKLLEALQSICSWIHAEFRQLTNEANYLHFCLDVDLIL